MQKYQRWTTDDFVKKAKEKHGDNFDYSKVIYLNTRTKVIIKCNKCGYEWKASPINHYNGAGCLKCKYKNLSQNNTISNEEFLRRAKLKHSNKFTYLSKYISAWKRIKLKCNTCGYIFTQIAHLHLRGNGCRKCGWKNSPKKRPQNQVRSIEDFEKRCKKVHNNKYKYCQDYRGRIYKIKIYCKKHKEFFYQEAGSHLCSQQGCPKCSLSKGEMAIEQFLIKFDIKYECEKKFKNCKDIRCLRFDFYLPKYNCCIEYDGIFHFEELPNINNSERLKKIQSRDSIKTLYCKNNGIKLIRIPYYDYNNIEEILNKNLLATGSI